ncbi:MAG TPA: alpha/beta fold hydrolase [Candidatus Corynebacterium avicola]|uniref:Alpha/beta fold hydrolase n=1 Tax=Candidatus Corynebacterium avicola TaxID=2838527 RepID=A0A9D1UM05_9CORY|nr:alpha/beta fold hydrolase [Candidatus Corynebacterium avicola]
MGKKDESPRRPRIADDLLEQLGENVREQVELTGDVLDDETIDSITQAIAESSDILDQQNQKERETQGPAKSFLEQLSNFTDGVRNTLELPSRLLPKTPQLPGRPEGMPIGARAYTVGCVDDLWHAKPSPERPYPVVLIHGTISAKNQWQNLVLTLREQGYAVFAPDYGMHGTQDVLESATDIDAYLKQVLSATGAEKLDIVGHSQGGLIARYWINEMGGADKVHHLVTLSSPHHGTTVRGLLADVLTANEATARVAESVVTRFMGPAGMQQVVGSPLITTMTTGPETRPGIRYSCLATRNDTTVVPFETAFLKADSDADADSDSSPARVWNAFVQDHGVGRVRHDEMPANEQVQELVVRILEEGLSD